MSAWCLVGVVGMLVILIVLTAAPCVLSSRISREQEERDGKA